MTSYRINEHFSGRVYGGSAQDMLLIDDDISEETRGWILSCRVVEKEQYLKEHPECEKLMYFLMAEMATIFKEHAYVCPVGYSVWEIALDMVCEVIEEYNKQGRCISLNIQREPGILCSRRAEKAFKQASAHLP